MKIEYLADNKNLINELAQIQFNEWSHLNPGETIEGRIRRLHRFCNKKMVPAMFVAVKDGILLGSAGLVSSDMNTHEDLFPWLASVLVKPEYRNQGIGSALVKRVETEARILELQNIYLYTPDSKKLYSRIGWTKMEQCTYMDTEVTLMKKNLINS